MAPLVPGGVAGFERRSRARGTFERNRFEVAAREQARDVLGASARQIDARARACNRRGPMMPPSTNVARRPRARGHVAHRAGRDRVRVDIDAAEAVAGNFAASASAACGGHTTARCPPRERALERTEIFRAPLALARARVAALRPADAQTTRSRARRGRRDCGAHLAG